MSSSPEAPHPQTISETPNNIHPADGPNSGPPKNQLAPPEQPLIERRNNEDQVTARDSSVRAELEGKHDGQELSKDSVANGTSEKMDSKCEDGPSAQHQQNATMEEQALEPESKADTVVSQDLSSAQAADVDASPTPPPPPPKDKKYKPNPEAGESIPTRAMDLEKEALQNEDMEAAVGREGQIDDIPDDSKSEIQSIMTQFGEGDGGPGETEIMSPRLEIAQPMFAIAQHPPRKSSLEPIKQGVAQTSNDDAVSVSSGNMNSPPPRTSSLASIPSAASLRRQSIHLEPESPLTPQLTKHLPPPPQPEPEPELPFDFHRFLEQLRHRSADPVARFLRSFLLEFGKRQWMVHEQVKIISDFLEFISKKMAQCEVWQTVSDAEFDNAREGMEKLVMNRLYNQTFSPAIPAPQPAPGSKGKRRGPVSPTRPGRRGQHQEDVERDQVLAQKVGIYGWVTEEHLDIQPIGEKGKKFMTLAQQELLKINSYRAPRDKVICILNCCKVIFGFLRNTQHDESADSFIPLLIYVVLHANPDNLVSNVQYILRFRNQDKLGGEAGYYISSLLGAIQFVEGLDRTSLTITDAAFEAAVEAAVRAIAEKHLSGESSSAAGAGASPDRAAAPPLPSRAPNPNPEKAGLARADLTPRSSGDADRPPPSPRRPARGPAPDDPDDAAAVSGLLKAVQRPLSSLGRMFGDDAPPDREKAAGGLFPAAAAGRRANSPGGASSAAAAARQASAEVEEVRRVRVREEGNVVETLCGMFPALDRDVIVDVVRANEGRVGSAVDACLALSQ